MSIFKISLQMTASSDISLTESELKSLYEDITTTLGKPVTGTVIYGITYITDIEKLFNILLEEFIGNINKKYNKTFEPHEWETFMHDMYIVSNVETDCDILKVVAGGP